MHSFDRRRYVTEFTIQIFALRSDSPVPRIANRQRERLPVSEMKDEPDDMTANALLALQRLEAASEEAFRLSSLRNYLQVHSTFSHVNFYHQVC